MINATSITFPVVSTIVSSSQKPSSVASYYQNQGAVSTPKEVSSDTSATLREHTSHALAQDSYYNLDEVAEAGSAWCV